MTPRLTALSLVGILSIGGVLLLLLATPNGIGVQPDSTVYLDAAHNLASGKGLIVMSPRAEFVALTHYPPLYPALVAFIARNGAGVGSAARWLNAIIFGINILLVGISIAFCVRRSVRSPGFRNDISPTIPPERTSNSVRGSLWLPVLGSFLALTAPDLLANHSVALTEPLYLATTFSGFLCLVCYLQNQRRWWLLAAAVLIALSTMTRYVGVTGIAASVLALLFVDVSHPAESGSTFSVLAERMRRRFVTALIFGVAALLPLVCLSVRNRLATGGVSDRQFAFHPIRMQTLISGCSTVAQWLLLGKIRLDLRFAGFLIECVLLAALLIYVLQSGKAEKAPHSVSTPVLPQVLLIYCLVYVCVLVLTITFFENDTVLDGRSLLPVHVALLVLGPWAAGLILRCLPNSPYIRKALVVIAVLFVSSYALRATHWLIAARLDSQGYASRAWRESAAIDLTLELPQGAVIYSNGFDAIYYLTGKTAHNIPEKIIHGTGRFNIRYDSELQQMNEDLRSHHGVLVYFETLPERSFLAPEDELRNRFNLTITAKTVDGTLYQSR